MGKLLIIADLEDNCFATPRGLELARKLGSSAEVVAFTYASMGDLKLGKEGQAEIKARLLAQRRDSVQARIDKYARDNQKVTLKVVWTKDIHPWIIKRAAGDYDAVVKTRHPSESLVYTSTDWHLLRDCPAPVLIVADSKWARTKPVLAAIDLSAKAAQKRKLNHAIIARAVGLARALDTEIKVISAIEIPTLLADLDLVEPLAYVREHKAALQPHLRELAEAHDLPVGLFKIKRGPVAKVISSEAARIRAQIVVLGTVGRKGVRARLIGNTAESVLRLLRTDVLALKP